MLVNESLSPESKNVTDCAANNSCRRLNTREMGGQVFACGLGGGLRGGVPRSFLVEKHLGSGRKVGFGKDDGAASFGLDFFGVSSPIAAVTKLLTLKIELTGIF